MELKLNYTDRSYYRNCLLIVPYGIETAYFESAEAASRLLIVPYGIETGLHHRPATLTALLIVPYGIETRLKLIHLHGCPSFNRTLWN